MAGIRFDENLQPVFESGDYLEVDGKEHLHQIIRFAVKDRLFGVSSRFDQDTIEQKIELAIHRIARNQDFINSVANVDVEFVNPSDKNKNSGYKVSVAYNGSESYSTIVDSL